MEQGDLPIQTHTSAMAQQNFMISPPHPFWASGSQPTIKWVEWKEYFVNYINAVDEAGNMKAEQKKRLLLHSLGPTGLKTCSRMTKTAGGNDDVFEAAIMDLDKYFAPKVCIGVTRHKFFQRRQSKDELVDEWLDDLKRLAIDCNFGNLHDDLIRDQLVVHNNNTTIQDRLWVNGDAPLEDVLAIIRKAELSGRCSTVLKESEKDPGGVYRVQNTFKSQGQFNFGRRPTQAVAQSSSQFTKFTKREGSGDERKCYRCDSREHLAFSKNCPALRKKCGICGIMGHFSKVCRRRQSVKYMSEDTNEVEAEIERESDGVNSLHENFILGIEDRNLCSKPMCKISFGGVVIDVYADSGSPYTIVNQTVWEEKFVDRVGNQLCPADVNPVSFTGECVNMVGFRWLTFLFKGRSARGKLYVAKTGPSVLGWLDQKNLHIVLVPNSDEKVLVLDGDSKTSEALVKLYPSVFGGDLGALKGFEHKIVLKGDAEPKVHKVRPIPMLIREEVDKEIKGLLLKGIIEEIETSEWISPVVIARKANGKIRLCIDLRHLNNNIVVEKFPLPNINEMVSMLRGATWFSTIDLSAAYHQIVLTPESRKLTAFVTPFGCYQFKRMPFGLASAAAVFQRLMFKLFGNIRGVNFFQDDILIAAHFKEEHDNILKEVLLVLQKAGLSVELSKCKFAQRSVTYLGHVISEEGVKPKSELVNTIIGSPPPTNKEEIRLFLGMAEYCAKYIKNFAGKVFNIRSLLKKNERFVWSRECEKEFIAIKQEIQSVCALSSFNPNSECLLTTDASDKGLGAVLSQKDSYGKEKIVLFASRALSPAEIRYPIIEREALACAWALEHFRSFVWGKTVTIRTDHRPLVKILSAEGIVGASARLARISIRMREYNYKMMFVPGKDNVLADCLSRLPSPLEQCVEDPWGEFNIALILDSGEPAPTREEWLNEQCRDQELQVVAKYICEGWPKQHKILGSLKRFWDIRTELTLEGDLVLRGDRVVPPKDLRKKLVQLCHEGHFGVLRTKSLVKAVFWWPGVDAEVESWIRKCPTCSTADKSLKTLRPPMSEGLIPNLPWEVIAVDIFGPVGELKEYGIVAIDLFTKWPIVKVVERIDTRTVLVPRRHLHTGRFP